MKTSDKDHEMGTRKKRKKNCANYGTGGRKRESKNEKLSVAMNEKGYTEAMVSTFQYMNMYKSQQNIQRTYTVPAALLFCQELNKRFVLEKKKSPAAWQEQRAEHS